MIAGVGRLWPAALFLAPLALALVYPCSYQQDGSAHYLLARWAARQPDLLLHTWGRPLFTTAYFLPAQLGYLPARLFTAVLFCATGFFACRIAGRLGLSRPWLACPLLAIQPMALLLSFDTLTETLFALILAAAVDLHLRGRTFAAAFLVSALPLVRPEGFPLCLFWAIVLSRPWTRLPLLLTGVAVWALAALLGTGDVLHPVRTWAWTHTTAYGSIEPAWYLWVLPVAFGPVVLVGAFAARRLGWLPLLAGGFFALQAVLWQFGLFGSAGYPRYLVCVSPIVAVLAAAGLERIRPALRTAALLAGTLFALAVIDLHQELWDGAPLRRLARTDRPVRSVLASNAYVAVVLDAGPHGVHPRNPRERNLDLLREAEPGTFVVWDSRHGTWLAPADFEAAGFRPLRSERITVRPRWAPPVFGKGRARTLEIHLFYKETGGRKLTTMLRLAHFSDPHVSVPPTTQPLGQLLGKRLVGSLNFYLGRRRHHFAQAEHQLGTLLDDVEAQGADHALCTGDLTSMSYEPEFRAAAAIFGDRLRKPDRYTILPGNHDRYTRSVTRERTFERWFGAGPAYPLRKRLAPGLTLVAVDAACPTWLFGSYGVCGPDQIDALHRLLEGPDVRDDFIVLALHYGPLTASGRPPSRVNGILDGPNLLRATRRADVLVHGHIHDAFWLRRPRPTVCAGSATDLSRPCGYHIYQIDPERRTLLLERRVWDGQRYVGRDRPVRVL